MYLEKTLNSVENNSFVVEIFGLGYVGFPLAVKLASSGFNVIGIDVNSKRVQRLRENELMDSELSLQKQFLESKNLKFTGSNSISSEKAMDKNRTKLICKKYDIPTPVWLIIDDSAEPERDEFVKLAYRVGVVVVKPNNEGSSNGVSILHTADDIEKAFTPEVVLAEIAAFGWKYNTFDEDPKMRCRLPILLDDASGKREYSSNCLNSKTKTH